jgi:hypothetical protein
MPLKWLNSGRGPKVIKLLDDLTGLNDEGSVTVGWGGKFETYSDILAGDIGFDQRIPMRKRIEIAKQAVVDAKKAAALVPELVLRRTQELQREYLRLPTQKMILLTSVSLKCSEVPARMRLGGSSITFLKACPRNFPRPLQDTTPSEYTYVKVHVSAREFNDGADQAFERIDMVRAIWNLVLNSRTEQRISAGYRGFKPVNGILLGPLHTLHGTDGAMALPGQWWYSGHPFNVEALTARTGLKNLKTRERMIRKQLQRCAFGDSLAGCILRYGRALDAFDLNSALLRLWAVLEDLTGTPKGNYDVLVKRASFLWEDYAEARLVLNYLREHRNQLAHAGSDPADIERLLYQLKVYVEGILWFLIYRAHEFASFDQFFAFLDLPPEVSDLRASIRQRRQAIAVRNFASQEAQ